MNISIFIIAYMLFNPYPGNPNPEPITVHLYEPPFGCPKLGDTDKFNGYYYEDPQSDDKCWREHYYWNPGVPTYETQFMEMPDIVTGSAWAYAGGGVEGGARHFALSLDDVKDGIALPFCSEIGNRVWIKKAGYDWEGPFLVVDCAGLMDIYNVIVHRGEVVEVGFKTALRWDMLKNIACDTEGCKGDWNIRRLDNIIVSKIDPTNLPDKITPVILSDWFEERASYFRSQQEFEDAYKPLSKNINGLVNWRFEPNGDWVIYMEAK